MAAVILALAACAGLLPACHQAACHRDSRIEARQALNAELAARQTRQTESLSYCRAGPTDLIDRSLLTEQRPQWRQWLSAQSQRLARRKKISP